MNQLVPVFEQRGESTELIVLLHAYKHTRQNLASLRNVASETKPDADILTPDLPTTVFSFASPDAIVASLLEIVDQKWRDRADTGDPYQRITIVGHSLGALIGRKLYVCACGENENAPLGPLFAQKRPRPWASAVDRVILLAGMNNGWEIDHHLSGLSAAIWTIGVVVGNFLRLVRKGEPIIFTIRRGAVFLTELRLQWLSMRRNAKDKGAGDALTIQLLGSVDDMVSPRDNLDLITGRDFVYLDVPHSGHANVIEMDDATHGTERATIFKKTLVASPDDLRTLQVLPADNPAGEPDESVGEVVFVIHGIRDEGYWTHKIARTIQNLGKQADRKIATETSSYGYFPILQFLLPGERRQKVQWFMNQYVEVAAQYPNATLSFVGHSHGTYLLAKSLQEYGCCNFNRVVFAGSVVRTKYDWDRFLRSGQVKAVANYVATADWVVAFFPKTIQMLGIQDLGSAGHDGFASPSVSQIEYVRGSHGAAIQEANWTAIADFIINGGEATTPTDLRSDQRSPIVLLPGYIAPFVWVLIALVVFCGGWLIYFVANSLGLAEWQTTLLYVSYFYGIWRFLMKY